MIGALAPYYSTTVFFKQVTFFTHCNFAVFNTVLRTVADTGHTVGTFFSPDGLLFYNTNIIQRT